MYLQDGPKFIEKLPSYKMVRLNEKLVLDCKVDSNPSALIFWSFNGQKIYAYSILTIEEMKPENYGTYKCTASLKDFPEVSSSIKIVRPGKSIEFNMIYSKFEKIWPMLKIKRTANNKLHFSPICKLG